MEAFARRSHAARRVLRPGGVLYLAVPNRWSLVGPRYRLPFLIFRVRSERAWTPG
jgi:SAM-dependent methyltransferase